MFLMDALIEYATLKELLDYEKMVVEELPQSFPGIPDRCGYFQAGGYDHGCCPITNKTEINAWIGLHLCSSLDGCSFCQERKDDFKLLIEDASLSLCLPPKDLRVIVASLKESVGNRMSEYKNTEEVKDIIKIVKKINDFFLYENERLISRLNPYLRKELKLLPADLLTVN